VSDVPWHSSTTAPDHVQRLPPYRAEHNEEIMHELGYDDIAIAHLHDYGAPLRQKRPTLVTAARHCPDIGLRQVIQ
jgi:hypothetical protein